MAVRRHFLAEGACLLIGIAMTWHALAAPAPAPTPSGAERKPGAGSAAAPFSPSEERDAKGKRFAQSLSRAEGMLGGAVSGERSRSWWQFPASRRCQWYNETCSVRCSATLGRTQVSFSFKPAEFEPSTGRGSWPRDRHVAHPVMGMLSELGTAEEKNELRLTTKGRAEKSGWSTELAHTGATWVNLENPREPRRESTGEAYQVLLLAFPTADEAERASDYATALSRACSITASDRTATSARPARPAPSSSSAPPPPAKP